MSTKRPTAPPSPNGGLPLGEIVVYAPRRWDRMSDRERAFVQAVHNALATGEPFNPKQRPDGEWEVEWEVEADDSDEETTRPYRTTWWPPNAPGFVTLTLDGGQFRSKFATGWWTFVVAAYTVREAYHLASRGEWASDAFTPGIRRMFDPNGTPVFQPDIQ